MNRLRRFDIGSARSLNLRTADYRGRGLAARMHVAERERVVGVELSIPEAVRVGEDKAPVVLASKLADERFVGLLPGGSNAIACRHCWPIWFADRWL